MNRLLWCAALAATCLVSGPSRAADAWADFAKPYITNLSTTSKNGNAPRGLAPSPHFITINPVDWYDSEQAAVSAFSWGNNPSRMVVGGAFRGYSEGSPWVFGIATEAIVAPSSHAQIVGAEIDVISRNPDSAASAKWGLNVIFTNRLSGVAGAVESGVGANRYNEGARAVVIESHPRSSAGEYSGWQAGIYFGKTAFDRTYAVPYSSAIDVSDVQSQGGAWYLVTWRCGDQKCGLKPGAQGLEVWVDIEMLPRLARVL